MTFIQWIGHIRTVLNEGLVPEGYYALAEQHAGETIADVLTLHASQSNSPEFPLRRGTGGTLVTEAPPRVRRHQTVTLPAPQHVPLESTYEGAYRGVHAVWRAVLAGKKSV